MGLAYYYACEDDIEKLVVRGQALQDVSVCGQIHQYCQSMFGYLLCLC